jgi:formylglycine-generating enzyme required for sulfatase activity
LTDKERGEGLLAANGAYRLPTDAEWSWAVGIGERERGATPAGKNLELKDVYPWGTGWPPPKGAGNYCDEAAHRANPSWSYIQGYDDGFVYTSPVGSFAPTRDGLYDLGGNVWEWCQDWWDKKQEWRVLRGGSWSFGVPVFLLSSYRLSYTPGNRGSPLGFRVVLAGGSAL